MSHRIRCGFLAALGLVNGCSSPQSDVEGPVATASASQPSADPTPMPVGSVPSTSTLPTSTEAPVPKAAIEARFLPVDLRCEKDADCAVTKRGVSERLFCCDSCDAVAGTKAWVARADIRCSAYDKEASRHTCPPRDCSPPGGARCNHGACELAP